MAQTTPVVGIPYPEATDHTRTWEWWQGIAEQIDTVWNTELGAGVDLDTITRPGFYSQTSRTEATAGQNYPPRAAVLGDTVAEGILLVFASTGYVVVQQYHETSAGVIWQRTRLNGAWESWYPVGGGMEDWTLTPVSAEPGVSNMRPVTGATQRGVNRRGAIAIQFDWTGATLTMDSNANYAGDQLLMTITDAAYRPPRDTELPLVQSGTATLWCRISASGLVHMTHGSFPGQTMPNGSAWRIQGEWAG